MISRQDVYAALDSERAYQDMRWGGGVHDRHHSFTEWIAYMEDYLAEAKHILAREKKESAYPKVEHIMRKVTGLGVAAMESLGAPKREGY